MKIKKYFLWILFLIIILELFSFGILAIKYNKISKPSHYTEHYKRFVEYDNCKWGSKVSLHPYFSIRYHKLGKCVETQANDRGVVGDFFPEEKNEDYYNILLLGGSVAELLYKSKVFEKDLNKKLNSPNGKPFKVWNGAIASGTQPRQSLFNYYYGEPFDLIISLEGYNEHFAYRAEESLEYAAGGGWYDLNYILSLARSGSFVLPTVINLQKISYHIRNQALLNNIYSFALMVNYIESMSLSLKENFRPQTDFHQLKKNFKIKARKKYLDDYHKSLNDMALIAKARNQKLLIVLQPAPAFIKNLSEEDKKVVGDLSYKTYYQEIIDSISKLKRDNLNIVSLVDILENYKEPLFNDPIHFRGNSIGNKVLSNKMVESVSRVLNE